MSNRIFTETGLDFIENWLDNEKGVLHARMSQVVGGEGEKKSEIYDISRTGKSFKCAINKIL